MIKLREFYFRMVKLTADLIAESTQHVNPCREREFSQNLLATFLLHFWNITDEKFAWHFHGIIFMLMFLTVIEMQFCKNFQGNWTCEVTNSTRSKTLEQLLINSIGNALIFFKTPSSNSILQTLFLLGALFLLGESSFLPPIWVKIKCPSLYCSKLL